MSQTFENWSAAQRGTGVLRQKRFPCSVSRIPYTCLRMNYFDLALLIATGGCVYDVCLSSFAPRLTFEVDIDPALQVNFLVFDCLGSNLCYYCILF